MKQGHENVKDQGFGWWDSQFCFCVAHKIVKYQRQITQNFPQQLLRTFVLIPHGKISTRY